MTTNDSSHRVGMKDHELAKRCALGRVVIIDDDKEILAAFCNLFEMEGYACATYSSALSYLQTLNNYQPAFSGPCCLLCDVKMPDVDGLELQRRLLELDNPPMILMSGDSDALEVVTAFRAGALDFLIKPIDAEVLLEAVAKALEISSLQQAQNKKKRRLAERIAELTAREREIARRVAKGQTNLAIAEELGIALRTAKLHRQRVMEKLGIVGTADLVRIVDEAGL